MVEKKEDLEQELHRIKAINLLKSLIGQDEINEVKGEMPEIYRDFEFLEKMQYTLEAADADGNRKTMMVINDMMKLMKELLKLDKYRFHNGGSLYQYFLGIKERMDIKKWEETMKTKSVDSEDVLQARLSLMEWLRPLISGLNKKEKEGLKLSEDALALIGKKGFFGEKRTTLIGLLDQAISLQERKREKVSFAINQLRKMRDNLKNLRISDIYLIRHMKKIFNSLSVMARTDELLINDYKKYLAHPDLKLKRKIEIEEHCFVTSYEDLHRHI